MNLGRTNKGHKTQSGKLFFFWKNAEHQKKKKKGGKCTWHSFFPVVLSGLNKCWPFHRESRTPQVRKKGKSEEARITEKD
jgi:hypothetical protein